MNMQSLMMQAKKMQKDMEKVQSELESKEYVGKSQLVTVVMSGSNKLISVNIEGEFDGTDKEMLEDMVLIAVNDAINKMDKEKEEKFGKYGQMFNGLM